MAMSGESNTKYSPEMQEKAEYYLDEFKKCGDEIPSHLGLADYLEICIRTIYYWAEDEHKKAFLHTLGRILTRQGKVLINKGLNGEFNSNIAKLMLANHGYKDKSETTNQTTVVIGKQDERTL